MPSIDLWAEAELGQAHFGDVRLNQRFVRDLLAHPEIPVPQACGDWAATKAASRFWSHPQVSAEGIRAVHREQTGQRLAAFSTVLAPKLSLKDWDPLMGMARAACVGSMIWARCGCSCILLLLMS